MKKLVVSVLLALFVSAVCAEELEGLDATSTARAMTGVTTIYNGTYDIFAYAGISGNTLYLVFRGTSVTSIKNWLKNLSSAKISPWSQYPKVQVHKGFYLAWVSVKPLVLRAISQLRGTCAACTKVQIVGHSLGGAMATLATAELQLSGLSNVHLYTLGSPRVGDSNFYSLFSSFRLDSTRLVNSRDIVPHLAPQLLGYHHITTEIWYNNGVFKTCDNSGEDPTCADSVKPINFSVNDHTTYMGINIQDGAPWKCDGVIDNKGPPGSNKRREIVIPQ